jgi:dipeptidyl aminopeptidase/acylaminoacyl peptidase
MRIPACSVLFLAAATSLSVAGLGAPPGAEVFGALPAQTDAVLSRDGHWLAWSDQSQTKPRIVIFDVSAHKVQRIAALPVQTKLRNLAWNNSETLLALLSETAEAQSQSQFSREYFITAALEPAGEGAQLIPASNGRETGANPAMAARLVRFGITKPHTVIMASRLMCRNGAECLLEVDTTNGNSAVIKYGSSLTTQWAVDRNGTPVAREDWDWAKHAYRLYALRGESLKEILRTDDANPPVWVGLLPDDSALVLLATNGRAHRAAWALPLDGSPQKLLAEAPDTDVSDAYVDSRTGAIIGVYGSGIKPRVYWIDPSAQHRQEVLERSFPNRTVVLRGWTEDGKKTLARVESPSSPPIYYLVDFTTHRADIAAEEYPALSGVALGEFREITYKARDGTEIPAYLTLPAQKSSGPGPLVVLPHGGPQARDFPVFDWIVQFLATRGYAVLQPQFRGSTGFGDAFRVAGYRQWGGLMQDDVTDGVRAMIEQGIADPKRVCIVGMSYGGYAALAGAAFTPTLYACAISVNGVSDLQALYEAQVPLWGAGYRSFSTTLSVWTERIGSPTSAALATKSPINAIGSISIPVMVVYGNGDAVVPNAQSERMAKALNSAGKRVSVVKLADEDHWLSRTDTRVQLLKAFEGFLRDNL